MIGKLITTIAMLFLVLLHANAAREWMSEVYNLNYDIENNSDALLGVHFIGEKEGKRSREAVDVDAGLHEKKEIESFAAGYGDYTILINGIEIASGPMGAALNVLPPVEWHDMRQPDPEGKGEFIYSLDSTYDKDTKTAKFRFILNNIDQTKKEL